MKSSKRLALLKYRAAVLGIVPMFAGMISASRAEVREEIDLATRNAATDSITDEEMDGWESGLTFDKPTVAKEAETAILLSRNDRRQLAQDVANAQLAARLPFALVVYSPSVRVNRPACETELREFAELSTYSQA